MIAVRQDHLTLSDVPRFIEQYHERLNFSFSESGQILRAEIRLALCHFFFQNSADDMEFQIIQPFHSITFQAWCGGPSLILLNGQVMKYYCHFSELEIATLKEQFNAILIKLYEKASR